MSDHRRRATPARRRSGVTAGAMNAWQAAVDLLGRLRAVPPLEVDPPDRGGRTLRLRPADLSARFMARLTGPPTGGSYPWKEVEADDSGALVDRTPGRSGWAPELNRLTGLYRGDRPTFVEIRALPASGRHYFHHVRVPSPCPPTNRLGFVARCKGQPGPPGNGEIEVSVGGVVVATGPATLGVEVDIAAHGLGPYHVKVTTYAGEDPLNGATYGGGRWRFRCVAEADYTAPAVRDCDPITVVVDVCCRALAVTVSHPCQSGTEAVGAYACDVEVAAGSATRSIEVGGHFGTTVWFGPDDLGPDPGPVTVVATPSGCAGLVASPPATVLVPCCQDAGVTLALGLADDHTCVACCARPLPKTLHYSDNYGSCELAWAPSFGGWVGVMAFTPTRTASPSGTCCADDPTPRTAYALIRLAPCRNGPYSDHDWELRKYTANCPASPCEGSLGNALVAGVVPGTGGTSTWDFIRPDCDAISASFALHGNPGVAYPDGAGGVGTITE